MKENMIVQVIQVAFVEVMLGLRKLPYLSCPDLQLALRILFKLG